MENNYTVELLENTTIDNIEIGQTGNNLINIEITQLKNGKEERNVIEGAETKKYIVLSLKIPRKSISVKYEGVNVELLPHKAKILTRDVKETIRLANNDHDVYRFKIELFDPSTQQVLSNTFLNETPIFTIYYVKGLIETFESNPFCILCFNLPPSHFMPKGNGELGLIVNLTKENEVLQGSINILFRVNRRKMQFLI